jgi:AcrR family transcriptional regulator
MTARMQKREALLAAAAGLFAERGFKGTVIADIAVAAGVGKGTVYQYFSSKEDLFFEVFRWVTQQNDTAVMTRLAQLGGGAAERLIAIGDVLVETWVGMMEWYTLMMEFWAASSTSLLRDRFKEAFRREYDRFRAIVAGLVEEGKRSGEFSADLDARAVASGLIGSWDAMLLQAWFDKSFDPVATSGSYTRVVVGGMAAGGRDKRGKEAER